MNKALTILLAITMIVLSIVLLGAMIYVAYVLGVLLPIHLWNAGHTGWAIVQVLIVLHWLLSTNRGDR